MTLRVEGERKLPGEIGDVEGHVSSVIVDGRAGPPQQPAPYSSFVHDEIVPEVAAERAQLFRGFQPKRCGEPSIALRKRGKVVGMERILDEWSNGIAPGTVGHPRTLLRRSRRTRRWMPVDPSPVWVHGGNPAGVRGSVCWTEAVNDQRVAEHARSDAGWTAWSRPSCFYVVGPRQTGAVEGVLYAYPAHRSTGGGPLEFLNEGHAMGFREIGEDPCRENDGVLVVRNGFNKCTYYIDGVTGDDVNRKGGSEREGAGQSVEAFMLVGPDERT